MGDDRGLLEREVELAAVGAAVADARRGEGSTLVLEGPPGIGKTALLGAGCGVACNAGVATMHARAGEVERAFPYGVVRQLFEPAIRALPPDDRDDVFEGAAGLAAPAVGPRGPAEKPARSGGNPQFAVLHGLYWLTANLASRTPLVLAVDDAHWADLPSQRFLLHLARRLDGLPVLLLVARRPSEPGAEDAFLAALGSQERTRTIHPDPLTEKGVARLILDALGVPPAPEFVAACHEATGGTPFLMRELLADLAAQGVVPDAGSVRRVGVLGPTSVGRATVQRLARLSPPAATLAKAVAVLGGGAPVPRAARLAGLDTQEAPEHVDSLVDAFILRPQQELDFVHPIVRTAVYREMPRAERSELHWRAAQLLADEGADPDASAAHLLLTEPADTVAVAERLRTAAAAAMARGAPEAGVAYLRRALQDALDRDLRSLVLEELAMAEKATRDPAAIANFEEARRLCDDPSRRARMAYELAELLLFAARMDELNKLISSAYEELGGHDPASALRVQTLWAGQASYDARFVHLFVERLPELRRAAEDNPAHGRHLSILLAALDSHRCEPKDEVLGLVERGLGGGAFLAGETCESWAVPQAVGALVVLDELDRAEELVDWTLADARARGSVFGFHAAAVQRAWTASRRGDLAAAEAELRVGISTALEQGFGLSVPVAMLNGVDAVLERPSLADLEALFAAYEVPEGLNTAAAWFGIESRGRVRLRRGEIEAGVRDIRRAGDMRREIGFITPNLTPGRCVLALAVVGSDPEEARRLVEEELEDARRAGVPRGVGIVLRTLGLLEGGPRGIELLHEAVEMLAHTPARLEHARALVELGAALRRANDRLAAREPLRLGLEEAHACGAVRLAERATTELVAAGARPRRARTTGRDALTPSEARVARMAADGLSNREIAQALFVSAKTVESHLGHVYKKLGVSDRHVLGDALEAERE
jgi:DNA-binding CsgD family transcriptional regulator